MLSFMKKKKKEKKGGSNGKKQEPSSSEDEALPNTTATNNSKVPAAGEEDDAEWEEGTIYSSNPDKKKVTKDDFELLAVIGKGSFGKVLLVQKKDDKKLFAMKVLRKDVVIKRKQVLHTQAEKTILGKVNHPFIVKLHYAFQTKGKLYMILDFINGGELFSHLKRESRFSESRVKLYVAEITLALAHLHSMDIVYRDLKTENILLDAQGHVVITDFGLSKEIDPATGTKTFCGTPEYLAPELLQGKPHGVAVDWWSLGTLMYEMLTGLPPWYSQNTNIMYKKILTDELRFPSYISAEARSLLEGFLTRDPAKRLGSATKDASDIKAHPFFADIDWDKLYRKEIQPEFKPNVKGEACISEIDSVFTMEPAVDSVVTESQLRETVDSEHAHFDNFTYEKESTMQNGH